MRRIALALVTVGLAGCLSRAANQRYDVRVSEIDAAYDDGVRAIDATYDRARQQRIELRRSLIPVRPGSNSRPVNPVAARHGLVALLAVCDDTEP